MEVWTTGKLCGPTQAWRFDMDQNLRSTATPEEAASMIAYLKDLVEGHDDHTLEQIGPCVYCVDCDKRLYQGRIAASHKKVKVYDWNAPRDPKVTNDMRNRWHK